MIQYRHLSNAGTIGSGSYAFRHYAASVGKSRLVQYIEGSLEEMLPEDFGGITTLPIYILNRMPGLKRVEMADTIQVIDASAISECPNIEEIVFPANIKSINYVFSLTCGIAANFTICDFSKAKQVPQFTDYGTNTNTTPFSYAKIIKVPSSLYSQWITQPLWNNHTDIITAV